MEAVSKVGKRKGASGGRKKGGRNYNKHYPPEFKLKIVKLFLEENYSAVFIEQETGIPKGNVHRWVSEYRAHGESGLQSVYARNPGKRLHRKVRSKIVELKKESPQSGVRRISQVLRRLFFLKASPEAVRTTLHAESLIESPKKKRQQNVAKPRFFERSTPNQLWQTDIFMFRLGGKNAYLIGYIDDYSRYITGLGVYRSQTAEQVIETYRRASAEYNPPQGDANR